MKASGEVSGTIDGQDVAGTVGSASLTSEKEATLSITKDYKMAHGCPCLIFEPRSTIPISRARRESLRTTLGRRLSVSVGQRNGRLAGRRADHAEKSVPSNGRNAEET
jgi:hypothetical protein